MEALLIIPIAEKAAFNRHINTRHGYAPTEDAFTGLLYADLDAAASHAISQLHNLTEADVAALKAMAPAGCHLVFYARGERVDLDTRIATLGLLARHVPPAPGECAVLMLVPAGMKFQFNDWMSYPIAAGAIRDFVALPLFTRGAPTHCYGVLPVVPAEGYTRIKVFEGYMPGVEILRYNPTTQPGFVAEALARRGLSATT